MATKRKGFRKHGVKSNGVKSNDVKSNDVKKTNKVASATASKATTQNKESDTVTGLAVISNGAWKFILAVIIVVAILFTIAVFTAQHEREQKTLLYNGFLFEEKGSGNKTIWVTRVDVNGKIYDIPFYYLPTEVEDVFFEPGLAEQITQAPVRPEIVYITLDPDAGSRPVIGAVEVSRLLGDRYGLLNLNVKAALTRAPETGFANDTIYITCADARDGVLVIQYEQSLVNGVWPEGNCIRVNYDTPEDSIRVSDRFAYELLSIM